MAGILNGCPVGGHPDILVLHADFWLRYARYLEPRDVPAAKSAVRRGQLIHCNGISEMQLFAARFHERHGDISDARAAHGLVLGRLAPGLVSAVQAAANFERRQVKLCDILSHQFLDSKSAAPLTPMLPSLCQMHLCPGMLYPWRRRPSCISLPLSLCELPLL